MQIMRQNKLPVAGACRHGKWWLRHHRPRPGGRRRRRRDRRGRRAGGDRERRSGATPARSSSRCWRERWRRNGRTSKRRN